MSVENPQGKAALHKLLWCFGVIGTFFQKQSVSGWNNLFFGEPCVMALWQGGKELPLRLRHS